MNGRGNELLAAAMTRLLAPALRRLEAGSPDAETSPLAAARPSAAAAGPPAAPGFQVSLPDDGKYLRYVRADCAPEGRAARFFLRLTPRNRGDLPPARREPGFTIAARLTVLRPIPPPTAALAPARAGRCGFL